MKYRELGRTGLRVSEIGFGCGNTGGLMTKGSPSEIERAVGRAWELGINMFDTSPSYGEGLSELHLGQAIRDLRLQPIITTKVQFPRDSFKNLNQCVTRSVDESLDRLGVDAVDVLYVHNRLASQRVLSENRRGSLLSGSDLFGPKGVLETFERLRREGKVRYFGLCSSGSELAAIHQAIDSESFHCMQAYYDMLNPTEGRVPPDGFSGTNFGQCIDRAWAHGMGVAVISPLAGGALTGMEELHPLAKGSPKSGRAAFWEDLRRARLLRPYIGDGQSWVRVALSFVLSHKGVTTALVGFSSIDQIGETVAASESPELPPALLDALESLYRSNFASA